MDEEVEGLKVHVVNLLANSASAFQLPQICLDFGLEVGDVKDEGQVAYGGKKRYLASKIGHLASDRVFGLVGQVLDRFPNYALEEHLFLLCDEPFVFTEVTRRRLLTSIVGSCELSGRLEVTEFVSRAFPIHLMPSHDYRCRTLQDELLQHVVNNADWDGEQILDRLGLREVSNRRFARFLEELVHPVVRDEQSARALVDMINEHIERDGARLVESESISGYATFRVLPLTVNGVKGSAKNLIFAAIGPKPGIRLRDALNNDIEIYENAEFCLVYDDPVPESGLTWMHMLDWWRKTHPELEPENDKVIARNLYERLFASLGSVVEQTLFRTYYRHYKDTMPLDRLPALVPQVYLHYDPRTARERAGRAPWMRQRMDFLLLFSSLERVVIEVDGVQHYSDSRGAPSPQAYSQMVSADRELRLAGYEVFRFGGYELTEVGPAELVLAKFFDELMTRYRRR